VLPPGIELSKSTSEFYSKFHLTALNCGDIVAVVIREQYQCSTTAHGWRGAAPCCRPMRRRCQFDSQMSSLGGLFVR
jgi:hypothetical protein